MDVSQTERRRPPPATLKSGSSDNIHSVAL